MSFNFIVVFCFCKSHISIACFFTSLKKYVSRRLLPLVPHDATSILILKKKEKKSETLSQPRTVERDRTSTSKSYPGYVLGKILEQKGKIKTN